MANRYLIVSDLHLADVEDHEDGWKYYKSSRYLFDAEFADLLEEFAGGAEDGEHLTLVFNGDLFDFDLVTAVPEDPRWKLSRRERRLGLKPTPQKSVWKLERILKDHPVFIDSLARFLGRGHKVVYVLGNHDREMYFDEVRETLSAAIRSAAEGGAAFETWQLRFEPWFYHAPGELYVEHGQQYDYYTSYRRILHPVVDFRDGKQLVLPMGNISNRYLMSRMGYFNPHATDYILNGYRYVVHWLRHYAFSRRGLLFNWLFGSLLVLGILLRTKRKLRKAPPGYGDRVEKLRRRFRLSTEQMERLSNLQRSPITSRFFRVVREFWIDRLLMSFLMTGGTIALALVPIPLWIKLMVPLSCFPLAYFIYEKFVQGESVFTVETKLPRFARRIADMLGVPVVTFGHTHVPRLLPLSQGVTFVDTGSWAPIVGKGKSGNLVPGYRNYLYVTFDRSGRPVITFDCWHTPDPHDMEITGEVEIDAEKQPDEGTR